MKTDGGEKGHGGGDARLPRVISCEPFEGPESHLFRFSLFNLFAGLWLAQVGKVRMILSLWWWNPTELFNFFTWDQTVEARCIDR